MLYEMIAIVSTQPVHDNATILIELQVRVGPISKHTTAEVKEYVCHSLSSPL